MYSKYPYNNNVRCHQVSAVEMSTYKYTEASQFFFFFLAEAHGGILVPQPEIELVPSTLEAQSLNQWTSGGDPT